jgi:hypothetical protein
MKPRCRDDRRGGFVCSVAAVLRAMKVQTHLKTGQARDEATKKAFEPQRRKEREGNSGKNLIQGLHQFG